jgi:RNA 2',3'-cyclic 3'-phosphodiesterase
VSAEKQHVRAFVAVHLPARIREKLQATQKELESAIPEDALRWAPFEQLHLTLEFLGNVAIERLSELENALRGIAASHRALELSCDEVGAFSSVRNPRVIWVGIKGDLEALLPLQSDVRKAVQPWIAEEETRAYRPHVTLGRVRPINRRDLRKVSDAIASVTERAFGSWKVGGFMLMQSKLSPHGSQHSTLATFPLCG